MFYYISFLRPPPLQVSTTPILITPQISNDLRTEYFDDPIDIYYTWTAGPGTTTKPAKLTSWRPSTAYKEIPVPRPPLRLDGQQPSDDPAWRLVLSCGTTPADRVVLLGETATTGATPFAVASMPVVFPRRHDRSLKGTKQERITRSYALRVPARDRPIVFDITEQTSFDLDKKIWDSGIGLSSWLAHLFTGKDTETGSTAHLVGLRESLFGSGPRHILELGAGTGVVSITLAVLRSTLDFTDKAGSILTTDLPSAIPILQENITSNHALTHKCVPQAVVLDWEHEVLAPQVQAQLESGLDVIAMADVTYNTASFPALIQTLARLIRLCTQKGKGRPPKVLMGYKQRHPDERSLWDRAKDIGLNFQQITQVNGVGGHPVEIWLG